MFAPLVLNADLFIHMFRRFAGVRYKVAAGLGISPATLRRWIDRNPGIQLQLAELAAPGTLASLELERRLEAMPGHQHDQIIASWEAYYKICHLPSISVADAKAFLDRNKNTPRYRVIG